MLDVAPFAGAWIETKKYEGWIYVNTLDKNLGFLLISATIDNPNINAQGFLPEGEELKAS